MTAIALFLASPLVAPQLLAFPHKVRAGDSVVWSETPIDRAAVRQVVARAEMLVAASPLAREHEPRRIFLTEGGWRWIWLANLARGSFALTRPANDAVIIVNRSDPARDRVNNGRSVGGQRKLSAVIAHETTHGMINRRVGRIAAATAPRWLVEGYCDHVARGSALTAQDVAALEARGEQHPAIVYYRGRQRVAAMLAENGGDVVRIFVGH